MKAQCILVLAIISAMTSCAQAASVAGGVGVRTCAQFAKDYQNDPTNAEVIYNNWSLGFMSGFNAAVQAVDKPQRDLEAISFNDKKQFMRDYCDQHPLKLYLDGVIALLGSLATMPRERTR